MMSGLDLILPGPSDPLAVMDLVDDFATGGNTLGIVGSLGWTFVAGSIAMIAGAAGHPGIVQRDTSAVSGTLTYMTTRVSPGTGVVLASEAFDLTWIFRLNTNDADTRVRLGLSATWSSETPTDAIYIEKLLTDTQWFGVCRAASTQTRTAALATVDTGWHKIRIRRIDASTIGFTLDAGAEVTLAANVPTAAVQPGNHIVNNAAASKTLDLDYFRLRVTGLGR